MDDGFYYFPKTVQVSVSCLEVLSKMLQDEEQNRIDIDELLAHPYFSSDIEDFKTEWIIAPHSLVVHHKNPHIFLKDKEKAGWRITLSTQGMEHFEKYKKRRMEEVYEDE